MWIAWAIAACGSDPGLPCEGGGATSAEVGVQSSGTFEPFADGDPIEVLQDGSGARLRFDYAITGLDARAPVTVVLRLSRSGEGTIDFLASANLRCEDPGPAEYSAQPPWPQAWADPAELYGETIRAVTVFTDAGGDVAEVGVEVVLVAPGDG